MVRKKSVAAARERIVRSILVIRGQKVILDRDLAALYGVATKALIQAVKRNSARFPADFIFQLSSQEFRNLRSQIVTSSLWGGRRTAPYAAQWKADRVFEPRLDKAGHTALLDRWREAIERQSGTAST